MNRQITPWLGRNRGIPEQKMGFSQKRKNINSRELVNPSDLGLIEAVWIHHKELGKLPKSRAPKLVKPKTKIITREETDP